MAGDKLHSRISKTKCHPCIYSGSPVRDETTRPKTLQKTSSSSCNHPPDQQRIHTRLFIMIMKFSDFSADTPKLRKLTAPSHILTGIPKLVTRYHGQMELQHSGAFALGQAPTEYVSALYRAWRDVEQDTIRDQVESKSAGTSDQQETADTDSKRLQTLQEDRRQQANLEYRVLTFDGKQGEFIQELEYDVRKTVLASAFDALGHAMSLNEPDETIRAWDRLIELEAQGLGDEVSQFMSLDHGKLFTRLRALGQRTRLGEQYRETCVNPYGTIRGDSRSDQQCPACTIDETDETSHSTETHFNDYVMLKLGGLRNLSKKPKLKRSDLAKENTLTNEIATAWSVEQKHFNGSADQPAASSKTRMTAAVKSLLPSPMRNERPRYRPMSRKTEPGSSKDQGGKSTSPTEPDISVNDETRLLGVGLC